MKTTNLLVAILILLAGPLAAQVPQLINYQGRIVAGDVNFNGTGQFKFALVTASGIITFWSNDGTSRTGDEPTAAVALNVDKGLYSVLLGNTSLANMTAIPATVFNNSDVRLRVWFNDGINGFQQLSPDQRIAAVGYAMMTANVENGAISSGKLADNAVSSAKLADNAVTSTKLATASVTGPNLADASVSNLKLIDAAVSTTKLANGAVSTLKLADASVTTTKLADGSVTGAKLAPGTLTSLQLDDDIELGSVAADGQLTLWGNALNARTIRLRGSAGDVNATSAINLVSALPSTGIGSAYASISKNGAAGGFLTTYDELGQLASELGSSSQAERGGFLRLFQADGGYGAVLDGDAPQANRGGLLALYEADGTETVEIRGSEGSLGGGIISVKNTSGTSTISIDGQDGTDGFLDTGGLISVANYQGDNRVIIDGQGKQGAGEIDVLGFNGGNTVEILGSGDAGNQGGQISMKQADGTQTIQLDAEAFNVGGGGYLALYKGDGTASIILRADSSGSGRVTAQVLEITGGSDLSEQFDINAAKVELQPGMVVCIDPANPGRLILSSKAYDHTVAGIVSGAGGVKPGMLMGQAGSVADGKHPVALTGRVYCQVDTANGAIRPGDLLTTCDTPGYAMKVIDHTKARGAIIGKAMSPLEKGKGLVLVLVSLQ